MQSQDSMGTDRRPEYPPKIAMVFEEGFVTWMVHQSTKDTHHRDAPATEQQQCPSHGIKHTQPEDDSDSQGNRPDDHADSSSKGLDHCMVSRASLPLPINSGFSLECDAT